MLFLQAQSFVGLTVHGTLCGGGNLGVSGGNRPRSPELGDQHAAGARFVMGVESARATDHDGGERHAELAVGGGQLLPGVRIGGVERDIGWEQAI